ncbi:MAG: phospholipase D-like domain-containing protein [Candidatus Thorarchaeota archaeon]
MNNYHKLMGLLIVFLMVLSVSPMTITPEETQISEVVSYVPTETYEWQTFNREMNVTTFVSPDGSRDELWHFLNSAEESIYVEIYGINHPHILDLIHELHAAKPSLDMKFLLGWNSLGYYSENDYVANNLTELGLDVKWTSDPDFTFAHQKFLIIDNETTIVHSGNWAKTSFPEFEYRANREWSIAMTDVDVTSYYRNVFDGDWINGTWYNATLHGVGSPLTQPTTTSTYQSPFATAGEFSGSMNVTPILSPDTSLQGILYMINLAKYTLDIQIPYFTNVGDDTEVDQIIDAILAAKTRGVTVRVISDEAYDFLLVAETLTDHGIPIVSHDTRWFTANHNKGIIVDGRVVLISSINYSDNSITNNREAGVIIENEEVAQWYQEIYDFDWGMGNFDEIDDLNLYWEPNIPSSSSTINVTVFAHRLNGSTNLDDVILGVKIADGAWTNHSIIDNIFESSEDDMENYYYEISPQDDGTNITVQSFVNITNNWNKTLPMVIHVVNEIGSGEPVDNTPPNLSSPDDIEYEVGTTGHNITWTVSDENPVNYTIFRNSTSPVMGDVVGSEIVLDIDGLSIGVYSYDLIAADLNHNLAEDNVIVTVVGIASLLISSPDDIEYELGSTDNNITWIALDGNPVNYTLCLDDITYIADEVFGTELVIDIDGLSVGTYTYHLIVMDSSYNMVEDIVEVTVVDTTSPLINSPDDIEYELASYGNNITWIVIESNPHNYTVFIDDMMYLTTEYNESDIVIDIDGLSVGSYTFEILVIDVYDNFIIDQVIVTVVDTTNPSINSPIDVQYELGSAASPLVWLVFDWAPANYTVTWNGTDFTYHNWSGATIISVDFDSLLIGTYIVELTVYDASGNMASDSVAVIIVDTTNPTILEVPDFEYFVNTTGHTITWTASDLEPDYYIVTLDDVEFETDDWDGSDIIIDIDGMALGEYTFNLTVFDASGNSYSSTVVVTVVEGLTTEDLMVIGIVFLGVVIVAIIGACFKKK